MTHTRDRNRDQEKNSLIDELESIRVLLVGTLAQDEIPLLREIVTEENPVSPQESLRGDVSETPVIIDQTVVKSEQVQKMSAEDITQPDIGATANDVLYSQQSFFKGAQPNERGATSRLKIPSPKKQSMAASANPFLPEHIRKRLSNHSITQPCERSFTRPAMAGASTEGHANTKLLNADYLELIDVLVAELMPVVEAKLRQKLIAKNALSDSEKHN